MKINEIKETINIDEGVMINIDKNTITAKGPNGEAKRKWDDPRISIKIEGKQISISSKNASKKQKKMVQTMASHIRNILNGVKNNNEYKLKICASHFPMQVSMEGNAIVIKNFFGEKLPRKTELSKDVQIKIQGDKVVITGPDIEKVSETAAKIEQTCRITNRDRRVFQDGIYLIEKNGREIS